MTVDIDPSTQANYTQIASEHVHFDWNIDWTKQVIAGSVTHTLTVKEDGVQEAIFDALALDIEKASVEDKATDFIQDPAHPVMGAALHLPLPSGLKVGQKVKATIHYKTTKDCMALQWLGKEQTQGKKFPYLFSQCQPIYARSIAPLQDTSSAKISYSANVTSTIPVLLSAIRVSPPSDGPVHDGKEVGKDVVMYTYKQPVPIPSYLIAIAAGNVRYHACPSVEGKQWKTGVWAEPEFIDSAYWEFGDAINNFMLKAESLLPPYQFGVYDVLVLPPSFPFGGMENACLTFLTPTLLVGDRSLVDVVIHELSHSWFGNGVTQAHSTHFWLNEGWTTYTERLILSMIHGPAERGFSYIIGAKGLKDDLELYVDRPKYQRLVIDFDKGEDPDDAYSRIPYEKGSNLILHLEQTLGGLDVFLPYVYDYAKTFLGKSVTTAEWKAHLYAYFEKHNKEKVKALDGINWDGWFYGEGMELPVKMQYGTSLAEQAYALAAKWDASRNTSDVSQLPFKASDLEAYGSNQIVVFLERLHTYHALPASHITLLGNLYKLSSTTNAEIRLRFYEVAFMDPASAAAKTLAPEAARWITGEDGTGVVKGRMKFCRPVFRDVSKVDRELAVECWKRNRGSYHPIARRQIDKDLGLA
ncbi:hypothetical protein FOMPIDRAFT_1163900 [Fomitopsis schrenkii]|uniref:Peptidase M1 leukotriene A4 hydrolase/aminopeptidase C-terminal domain-containing protein n=1 Tax=Fomitopsis schrenkii TaxID=2126942 RepID=S8FMY8_FOMSC|nr:hypothetical protein FOMPIDRAFT_1163900 [Fomitopsis schrenkii]